MICLPLNASFTLSMIPNFSIWGSVSILYFSIASAAASSLAFHSFFHALFTWLIFPSGDNISMANGDCSISCRKRSSLLFNSDSAFFIWVMSVIIASVAGSPYHLTMVELMSTYFSLPSFVHIRAEYLFFGRFPDNLAWYSLITFSLSSG